MAICHIAHKWLISSIHITMACWISSIRILWPAAPRCHPNCNNSAFHFSLYTITSSSACLAMPFLRHSNPQICSCVVKTRPKIIGLDPTDPFHWCWLGTAEHPLLEIFFSFLLFYLVFVCLQRSSAEKPLQYFCDFIDPQFQQQTDCFICLSLSFCLSEHAMKPVQHSNYAIGTIYFFPLAALLWFPL